MTRTTPHLGKWDFATCTRHLLTSHRNQQLWLPKLVARLALLLRPASEAHPKRYRHGQSSCFCWCLHPRSPPCPPLRCHFAHLAAVLLEFSFLAEQLLQYPRYSQAQHIKTTQTSDKEAVSDSAQGDGSGCRRVVPSVFSNVLDSVNPAFATISTSKWWSGRCLILSASRGWLNALDFPTWQAQAPISKAHWYRQLRQAYIWLGIHNDIQLCQPQNIEPYSFHRSDAILLWRAIVQLHRKLCHDGAVRSRFLLWSPRPTMNHIENSWIVLFALLLS